MFPEIGIPPVIIHFHGTFKYGPTIFGYPMYGNPQIVGTYYHRRSTRDIIQY